nr:MAG: hypothetical protein [Bacteriophage sp.]
MDKLTYYALTGMLKIEEDALEILKKRLSIIAERRPAIRGLIIEGVPISVYLRNIDKFCELIGEKTVEKVKCHIESSDLCQYNVCVNYDVEGKHHFNAYKLPFSIDKLKDIFDVEYV